jgi:ribose 5-phosphate isomerase B
MDEQRDIRKIHIGSDHAGYKMKEDLKRFLELKEFEVIDHGAFEEDDDDDYPDFVVPVALEVSRDEHSLGIILGGSGQGEAIVANRFPGIRTTVFYGEPVNSDSSIIDLGRQHNDTNILSLGARFLSVDEAKEAVEQWLDTDFSGEDRHIRRLNKIAHLDHMIFGGHEEHVHGPNCNHDHDHE